MNFLGVLRGTLMVLPLVMSLVASAQMSPLAGSGISRAAGVKENAAFVYHGKILRPDNSSPTGSMSVTLKILSPDPKLCVLWSETQTVDVKDGGFSVELGHTIHRLPGASGGAAANFKQAFTNNPGLTISAAQCEQGTSYTPGVADDRLLSATFNDSGAVIEIAGLPIKSVPFALQAQEIAGYGLANLMKIDGVGSAVVYSPAEIQTLKDLLGGNVFFDMKSRAVKNLAAPVDPQDAATKAFVESHIASAMVGAGLGTVTNVSVAGGGLSVTNGTSTPQISLAQASGTTAGYLSSADWNTFNNKQPAGAYLTTVPAQDASIITTGTLGVARGGTGLTPTMADANKVYGVTAGGNAAEFKAISAGTGISVSHSAGTIQISATNAGTVTSVGVGSLPLSVSGGTTPSISIAQANTTTAGYLSAADWNTFNGKQPAGAYLTQTLAQNQVFLGSGSNVAAASFFGIEQMRNASGVAQFPAACAASQTLTWNAITDVLNCTNINNLNADKITAGTLADARIPSLDAAKISSGTFVDARIPSLDAAKITSGAFATARLGSGAADATKYLRGDGTWQTLPSGADHLGNHTATQNLNLGIYKLVGNGGSEGIAIDSAGKVGIGASSAASVLDVRVPANGAGLSAVSVSTGDPYGNPAIALNPSWDQGFGLFAGFHNNGSKIISYNVGGSVRKPLTLIGSSIILEEGNVGVGTSSPASKLEVAGTIHSTSGGIKFPDGTTQTTASTSAAGLAQLTPQTAEPFACDSSKNGMLAATNNYTMCICRPGTGWVATNDGATACAWNNVIVANGAGRRWANGSYALSCNEYRNPPTNYYYSGLTGSGVYTIDVDGAGSEAPFNVYCDMVTGGGGYTLAVGSNTALGPANTHWDGNGSSSTLMTAYSVPSFTFTIAQSAAIIKHLKFARIIFDTSTQGQNIYVSSNTNSTFAAKKAALTAWTKESGVLNNLEWNGTDRNGYTYADYLLGVKDTTYVSAYGDTFGTWGMGTTVWAYSGSYPIDISYQNGTSTGLTVTAATAMTLSFTGHRNANDTQLAIWFK